MFFYVEITVATKVGLKAKQEKEREKVRVLSNKDEGWKKCSLKNVIN